MIMEYLLSREYPKRDTWQEPKNLYSQISIDLFGIEGILVYKKWPHRDLNTRPLSEEFTLLTMSWLLPSISVSHPLRNVRSTRLSYGATVAKKQQFIFKDYKSSMHSIIFNQCE